MDGGLLDNYPIWIFKQDSSINIERKFEIPENTLGLKIVQLTEKSIIKTPQTLSKYIFALVNIIKYQLEQVVISPSYSKQTVEIEIPDEITSTDFAITEEQRRELYEIGRKAVVTQLI